MQSERDSLKQLCAADAAPLNDVQNFFVAAQASIGSV